VETPVPGVPSGKSDEVHAYPRFSPAEMQRRDHAVAEVVAGAALDRLVVYGADRSGSAIQWLTGWPVTREAIVVWGPDEPTALLVQFYNHVPLAAELAPGCDVRWGGDSTIGCAVEELLRRGGERQRVGVIGPVPYRAYETLAGSVREVVDLSGAYTRLRLVKSDEELDWMRAGAALSDAAVVALEDALRPGLTEWELADIVERAYVPRGGTTHIHYFAATPMAQPARAVPAQHPSMRRVQAGDVVVTEISAAFWGYAGQVLRTFAVAAEPTPLYERLHAVAEEAFTAICAVIRDGAPVGAVLDAARVIGDAGFGVWDDLVHGFGGGYLPPVVGAPDRGGRQQEDEVFRAGMTVVVQPNVIARDRTAGVQTGELVVVTEQGVASLHHAPRGLRVVRTGERT
jgi:Xaa-Pro dipeptidase